MTEWWTYRLSDFLLFSPRTYFRLFELYHQWLWPAQPLVAALWGLLLVALWRGAAWAPRALLLALALSWAWIAWAFHWVRYAPINWAAQGFAAAFALQALLLALAAVRVRRIARPSALGPGLLLAALVVMPLLPPAFGRAWIETESFGLTPDATVLGTLGVLLMFVPAYRAVAMFWWVIPLVWSLVSGATLWAMDLLPWALVLPTGSIVTVIAHRQRRIECAY